MNMKATGKNPKLEMKKSKKKKERLKKHSMNSMYTLQVQENKLKKTKNYWSSTLRAPGLRPFYLTIYYQDEILTRKIFIKNY